MGCGSSTPEVNDNTATQNGRKKREKLPNVKIEINEDPEMQGEKFHEEEKNEEGDNQDNNEKDSFDDF